MPDVSSKVVEILQPFNANLAEPVEITDTTSLEDDLDMDDTDGIDVIAELEDAFDIVLEDDAFERSKTVGDLVKIVEDAVASEV